MINERKLSETELDARVGSVKGLLKNKRALVKKYGKNTKDDDIYFMVEFLLWGLEAHKKLNKYRSIDGFEFKDSLGSYIKIVLRYMIN